MYMFLTRKKTQEELREYINPDGKLNYFGTQKVLNDYCNFWKLNEDESYLSIRAQKTPSDEVTIFLVT